MLYLKLRDRERVVLELARDDLPRLRRAAAGLRDLDADDLALREL